MFRTLQLVIKKMEGSSLGRIVLVSSSLADDGMPKTAPYATAKSALHGLAKVLARELAPKGILVNVVKPGLTATDRTVSGRVPGQMVEAETASTPTGRLSTSEDIARAIVFLASAANGNATGQIITVNGGRSW